VEQIVARLARRAYRRPPTQREVDALMRVADLGTSSGQSAEHGVQLAIQALLVSPNFLFRIERDPDPRNRTLVHRLSPFELASRISYFLWSSMPDDELLAVAESGRLTDSQVLAAQVDRMLADPRASEFAANFAGQWLETRNLDSVKPDPDLFKEWTPQLREAMKTETTMFFDYVLRENRPITDFLNASYTFLNERLAAHYGIPGVSGAEFRRVELTTDRRGGVLSHAGVLTVSSYPTRTSAVIRGKYVLQNILGIPPAPPPDDVPPLSDSAGDGKRSHVTAGALAAVLPVLGGFSSGSSNARDAQLAEAARQAVDLASAGLMNAAPRLTASLSATDARDRERQAEARATSTPDGVRGVPTMNTTIRQGSEPSLRQR